MSAFDLGGRRVQVWSVRTEASREVVARFDQSLEPAERERAARFRFDHLRQSFVIARGALRILLGRYLGVSPECVRFQYGSNGKPALAAGPQVDFNVSHSRGIAVLAFTAGSAIGVDVEEIRPIEDMQRIAERFFCSEEAADLRSVTEDQRERAFFLCWTRKEAYIKATGDGLAASLDSFQVTLRPGEPPRFVRGVSSQWALHDLQLASNYAAALAYRDAERPLTVSRLLDPLELLS